MNGSRSRRADCVGFAFESAFQRLVRQLQENKAFLLCGDRLAGKLLECRLQQLRVDLTQELGRAISRPSAIRRSTVISWTHESSGRPSSSSSIP